MTPLVLTLALLQQSGTALQLHEVPKDGNCLFSAVALSAALVDNLPGQTRARAVRTAAARLRVSAMNLLCPHGTPDPELSLGGLPVEVLIEPQGGESQAGYCRRLRMAGEWGSTAEVMALSRVLERPIRIHTPFGTETYGEEASNEGDADAVAAPLTLHYADGHYQAATEPAPAPAAEPPEADALAQSERLRGGACEAAADEEEEAGFTLDALHAAASKADASAYLSLFSADAVFLGTDPHERWPLSEFKEYVAKRFAGGEGWTYAVEDRHVRVQGNVAWFDEALRKAGLGACRGTGVLVREAEGGAWRVAQYNLQMAIPNAIAMEAAALAEMKS
jgi:ketosteroid isomerase-like protein|eukprot:Transcript_7986.p1 GENE.Transcript_7986~~Transcript_7986.p1  ORF type:complete len:335 (+),score=107.60 Transcript_7986:63-1067(+)